MHSACHFQDTARRAGKQNSTTGQWVHCPRGKQRHTPKEHKSGIEKQWNLITAEVRVPHHNSSASEDLLVAGICEHVGDRRDGG